LQTPEEIADLVVFLASDASRSLTGALLTCDRDLRTLEVVAEQIAWRKGKSLSVGAKLPLSAEARGLLDREVVFGFDRSPDGGWVEWTGRQAAPLAVLLDYNGAETGGEPARTESAILCAPLVSRGTTASCWDVLSPLDGRSKTSRRPSSARATNEKVRSRWSW